jgi:hypothetical protein
MMNLKVILHKQNPQNDSSDSQHLKANSHVPYPATLPQAFYSGCLHPVAMQAMTRNLGLPAMQTLIHIQWDNWI